MKKDSTTDNIFGTDSTLLFNSTYSALITA